MFYAHFTTANGTKVVNLYDAPSEFFRGTFSPDTIIHSIVPFEIHGKTYAERKDSLYNIALDFMTADAEAQGGLSYYEWTRIGQFFSKNAKRYGLLEEFRENGIC